jgi:hypothetical protein
VIALLSQSGIERSTGFEGRDPRRGVSAAVSAPFQLKITAFQLRFVDSFPEKWIATIQ